MKYNFKQIEKKWQKKWEEKKVFEADVDKKRKKFFVSFPYPYINLSPHIGHFYSLMRTEAFARYKRLCGYNVLFPQAWHATGSPIVAAAERIKENEPKQIELLRKEGFSNKEIKKFEEPKYWIKVFGKKWLDDLNAMGMSIDWRRNFFTTSLNPFYDKFIRWQFRKLKEKNLIEKGKHPVVWDIKTNMPVGDHDRVEGEGEVPQEMVLFKFKLDDGKNIITATLRHDTSLGITNVYVNPNLEYIKANVNGESWIISEPMLAKLKNQDFKIQKKGQIKGSDLIGKKVKSFDGKKILVLPANFLDPNVGSGIVHSVPSDSADDLIALRDLQKDKNLMKKYNLNPKEVEAIEPIEIFDTPGIKGNAAQYFLDKYNVKTQDERNKLDKIKKELYTFTFAKSKLNKLYKKGFSKNLEGASILEGQKIIKKDLLKKGVIEIFYELTGKVVSRSLTECVVKIVSDQWFINYGNKKWKKQVHGAIKDMKFYPEIVKNQFEYVVDWLNDWACSREYGLGTKLPFDEKWLIESLSDSTIYMAYYTIAHKIKNFKISEINDEFFDYIFLGKGKGKKEWENLRVEFEYWYPLDFRNSGKDLVQNHLTFFLFNHVAIFPKKYWPKSIGVNGWVKVEGNKMSKSLGNVISLKVMGNKFGADVSRLTILNGGEGMDDPNWDSSFAAVIKGKFDGMTKIILENYGKGRKNKENVDKWMQSSMNKITLDATKFMEETLFRSAIQKIFFDFGNLIKRYLFKTDNKPNKSIFDQSIKSYLIMLSPFCPHIAEELWEKIGNKDFITLSSWPKVDESKIDENLEKQELIIENISKDISHIKNLLKEANPYVYIYSIPNEQDLFKEHKNFLTKITGSKSIEIFSTKDIKENPLLDPECKSKKAKPGKPGIYISGTQLKI